MVNKHQLFTDVGIKQDITLSGQNDLHIKEKEKDSGSEQMGVVDGKIIDNGNQIAQTKDSIQLGIKCAVKDIASRPKRNLITEDYTNNEIIEFKDTIDTDQTPALYYPGFTFTTYTPYVFNHFRDLFDIQQGYYLNLFYNSPLCELSDPSAGTSIFYLTRDDKFIMKSLQPHELQTMLKLLLKYGLYMDNNPRSLLPKFSGLYGYKRKSIDIKLVSMNNLLPSDKKMHLKYNLKPTTFKRTGTINEKSKPSPELEDLDLDEDNLNGLFLMPHTLSDLLDIIERDCAFLKICELTNYSLLLGIHKIDEEISTCGQAASARYKRLMVDLIELESIRADTATFEDKKSCPFLRGSIPANSGNGERLLLFVGIINILEDYEAIGNLESMFRRIGRGLTSCIQPNGSSISVQPPDIYATRFLEFVTKSVFKPVSTLKLRNDVGIKQDITLSGQNDLHIKEKEKDSGSEQMGVVDGKIIDNGNQIAQTKDSIQLGIKCAVKDIASRPKRNLITEDYTNNEITEFKDTIDTDQTPALYYPGFTFTTYTPYVFNHFRDLFDIQQDYYLNLFYNSPLCELSDPSAGTSIFYLTRDDKFIMKSLQPHELQTMLKLLLKYGLYMDNNPRSLLPKFSGLYGYKRKSIDIKLVSMNNLLPSDKKMHLKYNLKPTTFKSTGTINEKSKPSPELEDLDLDKDNLNGLFLMPHTLSDLLDIIERDCAFLKICKSTNYSLLLGIHKIDEEISTCGQAASARYKRLMVDLIELESIRADTATFEDEKSCPLLRGSIPANSGNGERLLLFVGIINILEDYEAIGNLESMFRRIGSGLTSCIQPNVSSISVQPPDIYATRFLEFVTKSVFKPVSILKP